MANMEKKTAAIVKAHSRAIEAANKTAIKSLKDIGIKANSTVENSDGAQFKVSEVILRSGVVVLIGARLDKKGEPKSAPKHMGPVSFFKPVVKAAKKAVAKKVAAKKPVVKKSTGKAGTKSSPVKSSKASAKKPRAKKEPTFIEKALDAVSHAVTGE